MFGVPFSVLLLVTMLTGLPLCDWTIAATCQPRSQRVTGERQLVGGAEHEAVAGVEVRQAVLVRDVVAVLDGEAGRIQRIGVERLRPGVRRVELQTRATGRFVADTHSA